MALTPNEIVNYPLKQAVRGYSVQQVDELLDRVADELERGQRDLTETHERLRRCEEQFAAASETEMTLKRTLVTAQRAAEQSMEEAKARAAEIIDEARRESMAIVEQSRIEAEQLKIDALQTARAEEHDIRQRRQSLESHVEALRVFEREYRTRLRRHLEEQIRALDDLDGRPVPGAGVEAPAEAASNLQVRVRGDEGQPPAAPAAGTEPG